MQKPLNVFGGFFYARFYPYNVKAREILSVLTVFVYELFTEK